MHFCASANDIEDLQRLTLRGVSGLGGHYQAQVELAAS
jgi:hypothetical protein